MLKAEAAKEALVAWCGRRGVKQGVEEFLAYLESTNSGYVLRELVNRLEHNSRRQHEAETAVAQTARPLKKKQQAALAKNLAAENFTETEVGELFAGATLEHDGRRFDASLKGRLQALKNHLHISHE